ncbi:hypothetical protein EHI8A_165400 [Entamoeba histolytica HM-1:IMSS-B]|uniref:SP-RING-type domain-containing protein n=6 Tax=Entamoeba histolytica TaxID=5759 RepID=C4LU11_ENTH1|nr:hypothetical protein, conserved [Entamoeba histolytica HM-1:IMSS]EMD47267.1 E3 SUMO protein ligase NSE2, putative [Entamoeba histolytica KU27]EMH77191.1 hypothetical protein EHI8A_165400 [Entamoeba histolytica HM-1:IMSS-B]EMS13559.1 E3 SUMO protein ligase NSE2, putative [Entamoeba histolytica HM-3:IMSS]ENY62390.1 E3 SUMO protein ligase NSE2, putative [Entamoeba histolytica HM-1:IMSS-A]GAT92078.1 hypothetical protein conserved [Entamoeba histolytica]|eukprot:XP_651728.1 hypothetical protein, conserved [Entamoeba histolytica HM-1:IMSS]
MSQTEVIDTIHDNEKNRKRITEYIESLIDCAETYTQTEEVPDPNVLQQYKETLKSMLELESKLNGHLAALRRSQDNPDAIEDERAFKAEYKQAVINNTETIGDDHPKIKEMKRRIWYARHSEPYFEDENEGVIISNTRSFICPLTKKPFVNPVKAQVCGHIFSKQAIYNLIGRNKTIKCPVAGCDHSFGINDLIEDYETQHAMDREKKNAMSEDSSSEAELV